jgi:pimeloyl-ACP methyl ester carboxylesterase
VNVLFLPGSLCDDRLFSDQLDALDDAGYECAVAELRPHISIASMAAHSATVFDGEPFAVVGLSLGGIVAAEMAIQVPELLLGVALLDTNLDEPSAEQLTQRQAWEAQVRTGAWWRLAAQLVPIQTSFPERYGELIFAMFETAGAAGFLSDNQALCDRHDRRDNLAQVDVPTLIAVGEDDLVCLPSIHQELVDRLPNTELTIIAGAGHLSTLDQPRIVTERLLSWLSECENHPQALTKINTQEGNHEYQCA